jgi:hypothetical protein
VPAAEASEYSKAEAGFEKRGATLVGKCPSGVRSDHAARLLNSGTRLELEEPRSPGPGPDRIYVFSQGVLYRAVRTTPGRSYHAFPEHAKGILELTRAQQRRFWEWARGLQVEDQVRKWLKQT